MERVPETAMLMAVRARRGAGAIGLVIVNSVHKLLVNPGEVSTTGMIALNGSDSVPACRRDWQGETVYLHYRARFAWERISHGVWL
jgi:hypothetical protein